MAVGILVDAADKRAVEANKPEMLTVVGRRLEGVAILTGNPVHQDKSKSAGTPARAGEVDCNQSGSDIGDRMMELVLEAKN